MKYLKLYKIILKNGVMPCSGLCPSVYEVCGNDALIQFINIMRPKSASGFEFWASTSDRDYYHFNPLRQNLLLLMAAMNNEL